MVLSNGFALAPVRREELPPVCVLYGVGVLGGGGCVLVLLASLFEAPRFFAQLIASTRQQDQSFSDRHCLEHVRHTYAG